MLGQYKDEGLKIEAFTTAYAKVLDLNSGEIENEMNLLLGKNHNTVSKILEDSKAITDKFHEENILENLISI